MKKTYAPYIKWIERQKEEMVRLLQIWAGINSASDNLEGLDQMLHVLRLAFSSLKGHMEEISLPPRIITTPKGLKVPQPLGKALRIQKRSKAPLQVFLGGHMDTVFPKTSSFQTCEQLDKNTIQGPGVADLKGGLIIMLKALEAFEQSPFAKNLGWEILINPDEEIGSLGSKDLFQESAKRHHLGLLFEPSFSDGAFVSSRKGALNFSVIVEGKSAHAGRDFHLGRSAVYALCHFISELEPLNNLEKGLTINVGHIEGGGVLNIVPEQAFCRFNARMKTQEEMNEFKKQLQVIIQKCEKREGIKLELTEDSISFPKPFDPLTEKLFVLIKESAQDLGLGVSWRPSGGVCDGNVLAAAGLPNIDTLGAIGGNLHTHKEYILINSLTERASLTALFLMKFASGESLFLKEKHNVN